MLNARYFSLARASRRAVIIVVLSALGIAVLAARGGLLPAPPNLQFARLRTMPETDESLSGSGPWLQPERTTGRP